MSSLYRLRSNPPRILLRLLLAALSVAAATTINSVNVAAGPNVLCSIEEFAVPESDYLVRTGTFLVPGRSVTLTASGSIWAGVWLTGTNGPEGWTSWPAPSNYPLPGAPSFGLLARAGGAWRYVGPGSTITNTTSKTREIEFRTNDNVPGNGDGEYTVQYPPDCSDGPVSALYVYEVVARHSQQCLDVEWFSEAHGANVLQATCVKGANQQWSFLYDGDDHYRIVARHSGKCLAVANASSAHEADVVQADCVLADHQLWKLRPVQGTNYFEIVAAHSQKCLDVEWFSMSHGANVLQGNCSNGANQHWRFRSAT